MMAAGDLAPSSALHAKAFERAEEWRSSLLRDVQAATRQMISGNADSSQVRAALLLSHQPVVQLAPLAAKSGGVGAGAATKTVAAKEDDELTKAQAELDRVARDAAVRAQTMAREAAAQAAKLKQESLEAGQATSPDDGLMSLIIAPPRVLLLPQRAEERGSRDRRRRRRRRWRRRRRRRRRRCSWC